jgi:hypothetical protein
MVLDGNVDPVQWNGPQTGHTLSTFDRLLSPTGAEKGLRTLLRDCAAADVSRCPFSAGTYPATMQKYQTLLRRLRTQAVTVSGVVYGYALTVATVAEEMESAQPAPQLGQIGWKGIAALLQALWTGSQPGSRHSVHAPLLSRANPVAGLATGYPLAAQEGTDGVLCGESPNPADPSSYQEQSTAANASQSPDGFGSVWTWEAESCAQWQARDASSYTGPWNRASARSLLVVGTLGDSNTAYQDSLNMAAVVGGARMLTETGGGHTALLNTSSCVNGYIDAFFASGALPPPGTVCDQDKPPF